MDFDPRDGDSRDEERFVPNRNRGSSDKHDPLDRDDDGRQPESRNRDDDTRQLGRGPGDYSRQSNSDAHGHRSRDDVRWAERDRDGRERDVDPRDVFTRHVNLPRGVEREIVRYRDRDYSLRGSESRTLATVGGFRVVSSRDLRDGRDRALDPRSGDLPYFDDEVHFPDLRIEYREPDGRDDHLDVEVTTELYRGAHGASVARSGFSCYRGSSGRIGGGRGSRGGRGHQGGVAEEMVD